MALFSLRNEWEGKWGRDLSRRRDQRSCLTTQPNPLNCIPRPIFPGPAGIYQAPKAAYRRLRRGADATAATGRKNDTPQTQDVTEHTP